MLKVPHRQCIDPMSPYIPGKPMDEVKKEYGLSEVIKLASNENPYGCSETVASAVAAKAGEARLYPDGGCGELRAAISSRLNVKPSQLVFGCGTDEVIAMIGKVFVNPGDECITGEVTFSQYAASVVSMGGKMVYAPMKDHAFDLDAILDMITDKTKLIFLANPNNPTGTSFNKDAQERFMEKVPSNILVVADEAYAEYVTDRDYPDTLAMLSRYDNLMLLKTFSKIYGLASYRVGYGVACEEIISLFEKIRPPFNVTIQGQAAALAAYGDTDFVAESKKKNAMVMEYACGVFKEMGLYCIPSQANFVMVDVQRDSGTMFLELMKKGYIIRPGVAFGMPTFLRITLGTMDEMKGLIEVLKGLL